MAKRQQLIVDTKTPAACAGSSSPYIVSYKPGIGGGGGGWTQKGVDIDGEAKNDYSGYSVSLSSDGNVVAIGATGNDDTGSNAGHVRVYAWNGTIWEKRGGDIDGEAQSDGSGRSVSLSSDGSIVAIGAKYNSATAEHGAEDRGHVRVYQYDETKTTAETDQNSSDFGPVKWRRLGADIDGEATGDNSGQSVSLSSDGTIVAIGAIYADGPGSWTRAYNAGHVRVYQYDATKTVAQTNQALANFGPAGWNRLGADIDGEAAWDYSGWSVSLSDDGSIVAIGAVYNDGTGTNAGHVRVYEYDATKTTAETDQSSADFGPIGWRRLGADIDGEAARDYSGASVSLSSDGSIVAIGAYSNDGTGSAAGHVRVYEYDATKTTAETDQTSSDFGPAGWNRLGADIDGEAQADVSGQSVSLSDDGTIVAIGAHKAPAGIQKGHVRVYKYDADKDAAVTDQTASDFGPAGWNRLGADIDGEAANDLSGFSVSLSSAGSTVAIAAPYHDNTGQSNAGHVRIYQTSSPISPQVGDWAVAEHKEESTGQPLSTYTYRVTHVADADTLVLKFVSSSDFSDGAWDISRGGYSGNSLSIVSGQGNAGLAFSSDGTKTYIIQNNTIYQYDLTTPWDISSGSYTSQKVISSNYSPTSLVFSSDGTKMFLLARNSGGSNHYIYQYDLTTPWSISSISYAGKSLKVSPFGPYNDTLHPTAIAISSDGTKVYLISSSPDKIYQYTLTTPWDISSGSADNPTSLFIGSQDPLPIGLAFSSDGTKAYIVGIYTKIYQYTLSTPWDISSGSYSGYSMSVGLQDQNPRGLAFSSDGKKVYTLGFGNASLGISPTIYQYTLFDLYPDVPPCDLCDGTGSVGVCGGIAPHVIKRDLGGMFMMLLD